MKLRRKLVLSAAALAACAVTLTSTTYAWYVSNSEATVNNMGGSTAEFSGGDSITVSRVTTDESNVKTPTKYTQSIDFSGTNEDIVLNPITKDADEKYPSGFKKMTTSTSNGVVAVNYEDAGDKNVLEYEFFVLSSKTTIGLNWTVTNSSYANVTNQIAYADGAPVGIGQGFKADALHALRLEVTQGLTSSTVTTYELDKAVGYTANALSSGNANTYFENVMGVKPAEEAATPTATALSTLNVAANTGTYFKIRIWLEGADADCYNSCAGQTFDIDLKLSVAGA